MFIHYLKTAVRHFRQHFGTTLINVFCLTFGLVAFLLAWGFSEYRGRADHYHARADRTVILTRYQPQAQFTFHITAAVLADYLRTDFPDLEAVARAQFPQETAISASEQSRFASVAYADAVLPLAGVAAIEQFDRALKDFTERRVPAELRSEMIYGARSVSDFVAIGMDAVVRTDVTGVSSATVVRLLGILVLAIACLNYTNLATAIALTRFKEVALRKVVGASRRQLIVQHLIEGGVLTIASLIMALLVLALIVFAIGADTFTAALRLFGPMPRFWLGLAAITVLVTLIASAYPALSLSRVKPAHALRGGRSQRSSRSLATLLVGVQFAASSFLMIAAFVLVSHHRDTRAEILESASDPLIAIANDVRGAGIDPELLRSELLRQPGIEGATAMHRMPWTPGADSDGIALTADPAASATSLHRIVVAPDFFETLQIPVLAGRTFDRSRAADLADMKAWYDRTPLEGEINVIVEDSYLPRLGVSSPAAAIDRVVYRPITLDGSKPPQRLRIIGVVAASSVMPMTAGSPGLYLMNPEFAYVPIVRAAKRDVTAAVTSIDNLWRRLAPNVPIKRRFADEQFDLGFGIFSALNRAVSVLAAFASLIAVVGLIGMALHITRRRLHEIGVRKTVGARTTQIYAMLLRSFATPVLIANIAVWPFVYALMSAYLGIFANRHEVTPLPFFMTLLGTLAIACLAVSLQAIRAARLKPAEVLRYE